MNLTKMATGNQKWRDQRGRGSGGKPDFLFPLPDPRSPTPDPLYSLYSESLALCGLVAFPQHVVLPPQSLFAFYLFLEPGRLRFAPPCAGHPFVPPRLHFFETALP